MEIEHVIRTLLWFRYSEKECGKILTMTKNNSMLSCDIEPDSLFSYKTPTHT